MCVCGVNDTIKSPKIGGFIVGGIINYFKKQNIKIQLIKLVLLTLFIVGINMISYAYFTASVQGTGKQMTISTSNAIVHFTDNNEINETGIMPGDTITNNNTADGTHYHTIAANQVSVTNSSAYTTGNNSDERIHSYTIAVATYSGAALSNRPPINIV